MLLLVKSQFSEVSSKRQANTRRKWGKKVVGGVEVCIKNVEKKIFFPLLFIYEWNAEHEKREKSGRIKKRK
jgi:hypothetical protein